METVRKNEHETINLFWWCPIYLGTRSSSLAVKVAISAGPKL